MRPGIADADGSGRCRLDAIARWLQDIAYDDLIEAGFEGEGAWIVRRTRIRVERFPRFGEDLRLRTFCSGIGRFSAERRTSVVGETGAVETVALWVCRTSAPPETSTVSATEPTSRRALAVAGTPASTFTFSMVTVLKPACPTVTV